MSVIAFILIFLAFWFTVALVVCAIYIFANKLAKSIMKHRPRQPWESDDEYRGEVEP